MRSGERRRRSVRPPVQSRRLTSPMAGIIDAIRRRFLGNLISMQYNKARGAVRSAGCGWWPWVDRPAACSEGLKAMGKVARKLGMGWRRALGSRAFADCDSKLDGPSVIDFLTNQLPLLYREPLIWRLASRAKDPGFVSSTQGCSSPWTAGKTWFACGHGAQFKSARNRAKRKGRCHAEDLRRSERDDRSDHQEIQETM